MILSKEVRLLIVVSVTVLVLVSLARAEDCTHSLGFWKTRPNAWPATHHTLGTVSYEPAELYGILFQPVEGNGIVALAHQLIAAKLNIALGASSDAIDATIEAADRMIGAQVVPPIGDGVLPTSRSAVLTGQLDAYNRGLVGPGPCNFSNADDARTWGEVKSLYQ